MTDHNEPGAPGIPPLPPRDGSPADSPTAPIGPQPTEATRTSEQAPPRRFFERTWVRVTAAAVAAVLLLGAGIGIGAAVANDSDQSARSGFGPGAGPGDDGPRGDADDDFRQHHGDRGSMGDRHGRDDDSPTERTPTTPAPAPSETP